MKSKQRASAKPKRKLSKSDKPANNRIHASKLETQLRLSIKFARLEARINALEAEVLAIGRKGLFSKKPIWLDVPSFGCKTPIYP